MLTTNKSRTYDTTLYQLRNLYFGLTRDEIVTLIETKALIEDQLIYMGETNCKLLKYVMNHAKNSEHQRKINDFVEWTSLKYLRRHIYDSRYVPKDTVSDKYAVGEFAQWLMKSRRVPLPS